MVALATSCLLVGSCSSETEDLPETVFVAPATTCDRELDTPEAQTVNEKVGGLQTPDFTVSFAQSTRLGTVTLVTGDVKEAFDTLTRDYGVSLVAELDDDDSGRIVRFEQIRKLVDDYCAGS